MKPYSPPPPSMAISVIGEGKTGKSFFGMGFPTPIVYFNWDHYSFDRAYAGFCRETGFIGDVLEMDLGESFSKYSADYYLYRIQIPADGRSETKTRQAGSVLREALNSPKIKTIVIDGAQLLWTNICESYKEAMKQDYMMWWDYTIPNRTMVGMYNDAKIGGKNLVTIHPMKDREIRDDAGKFVGYREIPERIDGWKHTLSNVDLLVALEEEKSNTPGGNAMIRMSLHKSGFSIHHHGKQMLWPTYDKLQLLIKEVGLPTEDSRILGVATNATV